MQQVVFLSYNLILAFFSKQEEVTRGLLDTITRLVLDCDTRDVISGQLEEYKKLIGDFGMPLAICQREKLIQVITLYFLNIILFSIYNI
jgi:hypothetical protein